MKVRILIPIILGLSLSAVSFAQSGQDTTTPRITRSNLRRQIQTAHSPEQYQALAAYFRRQERSFRAKANAEKQDWEARSKNVTVAATKYPRPVDSAHYLYDSYTYEADHSRQLAEHYELLAQSSKP